MRKFKGSYRLFSGIVLSVLWLLLLGVLCNAQKVDPIRVLSGHTGLVNSVAFSPDGRLLASGSSDRTVKVWDVETGRELRTLTGHIYGVSSVAFSPDGRTLASGSRDATIKLWDVGTGACLRTLTGHTDGVLSVAFSPDGKTLASGSCDRTVKLWDVATGTCLRTLSGHTDWVYSVAFSPDGKTLASGSGDKTIKLWDVATETCLRTLSGHTNWVYSVAFSPDGKTLASGSSDKTIKLWDVETGKELRTFSGHTGSVKSVAFSPDGKTLASGSWDETIKLWDAGTGACLRTLAGHCSHVLTVSFSPDGRSLASGSYDQKIVLWGEGLEKPEHAVYSHCPKVQAVAFSPDNKMLASGSGYTVRIWDPITGLQHELGVCGTVRTVLFSSDGSKLAVGTADYDEKDWVYRGCLIVYDTITWKATLELAMNVQALTWTPDRKYVVVAKAAYGGGSILLIDAQTGNTLRTFPSYERNYAVAISPDGKFLASGSKDYAIKLWDVKTGRELRTLSGHWGPVYSVAFSPDGKTLASGSGDNTVKLWDVATGRELRTLSGHTHWVYSVAFSPDGRTLASGSADKTIKLWDVATGSLLCTINGHAGWVMSVAFSPDGRLLASGSSDATVKIWDVEAVLHPNDLPSALFTWEALSPEGTRLLVQPRIGDRIRFDASGSKDPDGQIIKYEWDWTSDGTYDLSTSDPVVEYRFPTAGTHRVTLRVTDDQGATATTSQVVTIGEKRPPVADFTFSPALPSTLDTVQFADRSTDPDGQVVSWKWEFGDGGTSTERNPVHRYSQKKPFTVRLTVTDNDGQSATATKTLTVVNLPPEAFFTFAPKDPYAGAEVTFDASGSQDKDGTIRSYAWDFTGDEVPDKEGPMVTWTFSSPGTYQVTLTVTDDDGAKATSKDVLVVKLSPQPVEARRVWALVVGISAYREPSLNLRYARKDAEAFARWLTETARVPKDQVQVLLDEQATLTEVRAGLEWLRRRADEDDLVIVFFAGHGYQGADLPPVDEKDGLDEYFVLHDTRRDAVEATALRDDEFGVFLDRLLSRHVLVVFDSCHAGGGEREVRGLPRGARPVGETLDIWGDFSLEGKIVLAAAKEDQESRESDALEHGVFTYFLLRGLGGEADENRDGKVTVQEVHAYVSREVPKYVWEKLGKDQHPQMLGRGMPLVVLAKANQPPKAEFTFAPEAPFPGKRVEFRDTSTDDGVIVSWRWDFGDGATSAEQHPTHAYSEPGTYTVTLTVTDDGGLSSSVTKTVTVGPYGEVTAVDLGRGLVTISLGSRHGVKVGDRFEVVQFHEVGGGVVLPEVRAVVEVIQVLSPDRAACKVLDLRFPVQVKDKVRLAYPAP